MARGHHHLEAVGPAPEPGDLVSRQRDFPEPRAARLGGAALHQGAVAVEEQELRRRDILCRIRLARRAHLDLEARRLAIGDHHRPVERHRRNGRPGEIEPLVRRVREILEMAQHQRSLHRVDGMQVIGPVADLVMPALGAPIGERGVAFGNLALVEMRAEERREGNVILRRGAFAHPIEHAEARPGDEAEPLGPEPVGLIGGEGQLARLLGHYRERHHMPGQRPRRAPRHDGLGIRRDLVAVDLHGERIGREDPQAAEMALERFEGRHMARIEERAVGIGAREGERVGDQQICRRHRRAVMPAPVEIAVLEDDPRTGARPEPVLAGLGDAEEPPLFAVPGQPRIVGHEDLVGLPELQPVEGLRHRRAGFHGELGLGDALRAE